MFRDRAIKAALAGLASAGLIFSAGPAFAGHHKAAKASVSAGAAAVSGPGASLIELDTDPFSVNYFIHAQTLGPDDTLRVVDPIQWTESENSASCVNVYVFDARQELQECCSCLITPAGRLDFSLNKNLTATPVTGGPLTTGTVKIVRTHFLLDRTGKPTCFAATGGGELQELHLFAWLTHDVNQFNSDRNAVEEAEFQSTSEPDSDLITLQDKCQTTLNTGEAHGTGACSCPAPVIP